MANNKMTMDEAYTCPRCGGLTVNVGAMEQIFEDARSEDVICMKCNSTWRVFYKMTELNKRILNITDTPLEDTAETTANTSDCDVVETSAEDCPVVDEELGCESIAE